MAPSEHSVPVIDLFAGPGGLGEGFSRYKNYLDGTLQFDLRLSVEKDDAAVRTLRLRSFFRHFEQGRVPEVYYDYIKSETVEEKARFLRIMRSHSEWRRASAEVWKRTLGEGSVEAFFKLHRRIKRRVGGVDRWVLLGGPPCQAYSVAGRSRRLGDGRDLRLNLSDVELRQRRQSRASQFFQDERHTLYTDYLEIVALHQPPVFVMENVKGILTSKLPVAEGGRDAAESGSALIFDRIIKDMADPWLAIKNEKLPEGWQTISDGRRLGYNIYSFSVPPNILLGDNVPEDYLIQSEFYGVPQDRHRVILLGVREDVNAVPRPLVRKQHQITVRDTIGDLPPLRSGRSGRSADGKTRDRNVDSSQAWAEAVRAAVPSEVLSQIEPKILRDRIRDVQTKLPTNLSKGLAFSKLGSERAEKTDLDRWLLDSRLNGVVQHKSRHHMDQDLGRYLFASIYAEHFGRSPKLRHFPEGLLPRHGSVFKVGSETEQSRIFADRFRVQVAGKPSTTIVSHICKDGHYYIHYDPFQCRSLTVREAARLQTFPDNYYFEGNQTEQYGQVGNAVPPYLALQLATVVADVLVQDVPARVVPRPRWPSSSVTAQTRRWSKNQRVRVTIEQGSKLPF